MTEPDADPITAPERVRYKGASMQPTFKPGQILYVRPLASLPQPGDVVVYRNSRHELVVHRVIVATPDGLHTRGDNNSQEDEIPVRIDQVVGVVDSLDEGGGRRQVMGGRSALRQAQRRWRVHALMAELKPRLGAPYRWLKATGLARKIWHPRITIIRLQTSDGDLFKYVLQGKTVAVWQPQIHRFSCKRPYDLILFPPVEKQG